MSELRFTRHARNKMRLYGFTEADAERIHAHPISTDSDSEGRPIYIGMVGERRVRLIVATDDPELVVTFDERSR